MSTASTTIIGNFKRTFSTLFEILNYSSVIYMTCAPNLEHGYPSLVRVEDCVHYIDWGSSLVCPQESPSADSTADLSMSSSCILTDRSSGATFDFSSSHQQSITFMSGERWKGLDISICPGQAPSPCGEGVAVCQTTENSIFGLSNKSRASYPSGLAEGIKLEMRFDSDSPCGAKTKSAIIWFLCGDKSRAVVASSTECGIIVTWMHPGVCEEEAAGNELSSEVCEYFDGAGHKIDFTVLSTLSDSWQIDLPHNSGKIVFNPCGGVKSKDRSLMKACSASAACLLTDGSHWISIANSFAHSTVWEAEEKVIVEYSSKQICKNEKMFHFKITFTCCPKSLGKAEYDRREECT